MDCNTNNTNTPTTSNTVSEEYQIQLKPICIAIGTYMGAFVCSAVKPNLAGALIGGYIGSQIGETVKGGIYIRKVTSCTENPSAQSTEESTNS